MTFELACHLPRWGLAPDTPVRLLNVSENLTFRADPSGGPPLVIRLHRPAYHEAEEIRSEVAWIEALRDARVVDTPAPLAGTDGEFVQKLAMPEDHTVRYAVAYAFVPGAEPVPNADLPRWFGRLGATTAKLHDHARRWTRPPGFRRKTWDWNAMFGPGAFWGDWRQGVGLDAPARVLLGQALDLINLRLERLGRDPDRFGLIHADLRLANLLVEGDRLQIIDFDDGGFGWHMYDFAAAVSFFEHEPIVDDLRAAWVDGYRTIRPLSRDDAAELPMFVAMRRFLLVAWIASHPEVPIAQQLGASYTAGALTMADRLLSSHG